MAAMKWLLPAAILVLAGACGTHSGDPSKLPSWISAYPGTSPQRAGSAFTFRTQDPAERVLDFYQSQLMKSGLHMEARGGGEYGGILSAGDDAHTRSVMIEIRADKGASEVTITPVEKK